MIAALLRAQLLSMRSFRLGAGRPAALLAVFTSLVWYGFWTAIAAAVYGVVRRAPEKELPYAVPVVLLLATAYWQMAPLVSASLGAALDLRKLLAYPIPHRKLFFVEVLLRLTTAGEMVLVVAAAGAGVIANRTAGGWPAAPRVAVALLLFAAVNLTVSAGVRNLLERLLARKRLREALILLLVIAAAAPRVLIELNVPLEPLRRWYYTRALPLWPWTAAGELALGQRETLAFAALAAWAAAAYVFGRRQFERSLRFDAQAAAATELSAAPSGGAWSEALFRLPGRLLGDPVAAIVEKELRTLSRNSRFRLVFIMGFSFGLLVWLPLILRPGDEGSPLADNFLVFVAVYALTMLGQVTYWNSLGFDRSAAQIWFVLPAPFGRALAGKNIAAALLVFLELIAITLVCLLFRVPLTPGQIAEGFAVTLVAAVYMVSIGNLTSVHFPKAMSPERVSQGGASTRFHALIFLVFPIGLAPVLLAYAARWALDAQWAFNAVLAFAAVLAGVVYWIAMESAVETAARRREQILLELSRAEGPVAAD